MGNEFRVEFDKLQNDENEIVVDVGDSEDYVLVFSKPVERYETRYEAMDGTSNFETESEDGSILKIRFSRMDKKMRMFTLKVQCMDKSNYLLIVRRSAL